MNISHRWQEWLADRVSWVQYPQITRERAKREGRSLRWYEAAGLLLYAGFATLGGLALLAIGAFILFLVVSALF